MTTSTHSAGASAATWAHQLRKARPWWRRLADWLGWWPDTRTGATWTAGAAGERQTAALIDPLRAHGWHVRHDLAIPGTHANIDHLLVPPHGRYVIALDSKLWSRQRGPVTVRRGRLVHGVEDRHRSIETAAWEASRVQAVLGVDTVPVIVVHSAPVQAGLAASSVRVVDTAGLLPLLHAHAARHRTEPARVRRITQAAARALPDYR